MFLTDRPKDFEAINEIQSASDRATGVVLGALLDSQLNDLIRRELHRDDSAYSKTVRKEVFSVDGPLGNFRAKVNIAYLLGYFTPYARDDLKTFATIRNVFAHYTDENTFESERMKTLCGNLKLINSSIFGPNFYRGEGETMRVAGDSVGHTQRKPGISLHLVDPDTARNTPRGRFIATAKLFCAAFHVYSQDSERFKPFI